MSTTDAQECYSNSSKVAILLFTKGWALHILGAILLQVGIATDIIIEGRGEIEIDDIQPCDPRVNEARNVSSFSVRRSEPSSRRQCYCLCCLLRAVGLQNRLLHPR